jgi:predicted DNA-binding antitoxin AbrB/MazE fold protein
MSEKLRAIYKSGVVEPTKPLKVAEGTEVYIVVPKAVEIPFQRTPIKARILVTPEEEFKKKYPHIEVEPEFFRLVGCIADVSSAVSNKELLIDTIIEKYQQ